MVRFHFPWDVSVSLEDFILPRNRGSGACRARLTGKARYIFWIILTHKISSRSWINEDASNEL